MLCQERNHSTAWQSRMIIPSALHEKPSRPSEIAQEDNDTPLTAVCNPKHKKADDCRKCPQGKTEDARLAWTGGDSWRDKRVVQGCWSTQDVTGGSDH